MDTTDTGTQQVGTVQVPITVRAETTVEQINPEVQDAIVMFERQVEYLGDLVDRMTAKLDPVLRPEDPRDTLPDRAMTGVKLADRIALGGDTLARYNAALESVYGRVAL